MKEKGHAKLRRTRACLRRTTKCLPTVAGSPPTVTWDLEKCLRKIGLVKANLKWESEGISLDQIGSNQVHSLSEAYGWKAFRNIHDLISKSVLGLGLCRGTIQSIWIWWKYHGSSGSSVFRVEYEETRWRRRSWLLPNLSPCLEFVRKNIWFNMLPSMLLDSGQRLFPYQ